MADSRNVIQSGPRRRFLKRIAMHEPPKEIPGGRAVDRGKTPPAVTMATKELSPPSQINGAVTPPSGAVVTLNKIGFGPRPGDVTTFNSLGGSDSLRLAAYLAEQTSPDPDPTNDPEVFSKLSASDFSTLNKTRTQLWTEHVLPDDGAITWAERVRPRTETRCAAFTRAAFSRWQLKEVLADFWHNHFNVDAEADWLYSMFVHYDRDVIRANIFGNFRQMLEDVSKSTCMLLYLDNFLNTSDGPNENYGREVLELHTLGAGNYFGTIPSADVPDGPGGVKIGYVEEDVKEFARALTGWSIQGSWWDDDPSDGSFVLRISEHDQGTKTVLGQDFTYSAGTPESDCLEILDMLAAHAGTASFIAEKLCRRLISDDPPQTLIDSTATVFQAQWLAPDQLKQVVEHVVSAPEFLATWGEKIKRPFETLAGTMRAYEGSYNLIPFDEPSASFLWMFSRTGHESFAWTTPDGYPDKRPTWEGGTPLVMSWRLQQALHDSASWLVGSAPYPLLSDTQAQFPVIADRTPNNMAAFWFERILGYPPDAPQLQRLADFMALQRQADESFLPGGVDTPVDIESNDWPDYRQAQLRAMIGMIVMSPEFLRR